MTTDAMKSIDALTRLVEVLEPLQSEERLRLVRAAMALLGEGSPGNVLSGKGAAKIEMEHKLAQ
jgi:hypothetical protein